ncbi:MAG: hypothetical protein JWQ60_786, partial [Pseudonocardia sp.]|nr:hypothetical protein [Pseudonocardia sp.]
KKIDRADADKRLLEGDGQLTHDDIHVLMAER